MSFYIGLGTFWGSSWKSIYHGLALLRHSIKQEPASEWISYIIGYKNMRQKLVQPAFHFCAFRPQNKHHWRSICTPSMYYFRNSNKYFICTNSRASWSTYCNNNHMHHGLRGNRVVHTDDVFWGCQTDRCLVWSLCWFCYRGQLNLYDRIMEDKEVGIVQLLDSCANQSNRTDR